MPQYWHASRSKSGGMLTVALSVGVGPGWHETEECRFAVAPEAAIRDAIATGSEIKIAAAVERWADEMKRGAQGCPLVPSEQFPGELTLACDSCGSTALTGTVEYPGRGSGPGGRGRLGDAGSRDVMICRECGRRHYDP